MTTRILLLRHGQSTWNAEGRWQGWADPPLSALGERQARDAAEHLRATRFDAVVSSDLQRARHTAELIVEVLGLDLCVEVLEGLRERDAGRFSGLTREEIEERFPGVLRRAGATIHPPEALGEDVETFLQRITTAVHKVAADHHGQVVLAVTHGGVIRRLERTLGAAVPERTVNCAGRWVHVSGGQLGVGPPVVPIDHDLETAPPPH